MKATVCILIACSCFLSVCSGFAQDVITMKNGNEIQARILEITPTEVKYKKFGNETGPTYTEFKTVIFMIKYENGDKDVFNTVPTETKMPVTATVTTTTPVQDQVSTTVTSQPVPALETPKKIIPSKRFNVGFDGGFGWIGEDLFGTKFGKAGLLNLNFGYLSQSGNGAFASGLIGFSRDDNAPIDFSMAGFVGGYQYSTQKDKVESVEYDGRFGLGYGTVWAGSDEGEGAFLLSGGITIRANIENYVSFTLNYDYYHVFLSNKGKLCIHGFSLGMNYHF